MKTILMAIYNMKGGVSKTTSTLELGYHLACDGFKVLLVDADMQANLTTNIIMSSQHSDKPKPSEVETKEEHERDPMMDADFACDRLWEEIKRKEKGGEKKTFHGIISEFTGARLYLSKSSLLDRIVPLNAKMRGADGNSIHIDYIAGHMLTGDLDEKIADGFRDPNRYPIPGLVTNVFREYAELNGYDFVLFDLGGTLTSTVKAILLGSDYIISPFKCERACKTAAEIVLKKLRDWHMKTLRDDDAESGRKLPNPDCVLKVREVPPEEPGQIPVRLKCYPQFLGAFAVGVKLKYKQPTAPYQLRINEIFERYETDLAAFRHAKLTRCNLDALKKLFVENSESAGKEAEGGGALIDIAAIPCVSLCYETYKQVKKTFPIITFLTKAKAILSQYQNILRALINNMEPEHREQILKQSKKLFKKENQKQGYLTSEKEEKEVPAAKRAKNTLSSNNSSMFPPVKLTCLRSGHLMGLPGFKFVNVPGDGNCFYHAVVHQFKKIKHVFLTTVPDGTAPHDSLRLRVQGGEDFLDGEWSDHEEMLALARQLNLVIGIIDLRDSKHRFVYHYINNQDNGDFTKHRGDLPINRQIIRLSYDGGHYMSVDEWPKKKTVQQPANSCS